MSDQLLLEVQDLQTHFFLDRGIVRAVDGVSFGVEPGRTLGVLGESGCGKSVTGYSILRLVQKPGRTIAGHAYLRRRLANGRGGASEVVDLIGLDPQGPEIRRIRGHDIAMVFQEPMTFLNPVYTLGNQIMEGILLHRDVSKQEARSQAIEMLRLVGMPDPNAMVDRYPHQLSGGMRQRGIIAIALSCHPSLLIADEPTTALDVTTEAQILDLMRGLQADLGMAILFITHNLGVIAEMAERVIVMYLGNVVEEADVRTLFREPKHPYTKALLQSIPKIGRKSRSRLNAIKGMVPDPLNIPAGCRFHDRCPQFMPGKCDVMEPEMVEVGPDHSARCLLYGLPGG
ncbi:MAG: ABC transporter ATP-binding protein [Chloroflexi bacterium]|nr:ABC transporter ATP-binding protein [Chloroflexota bacterium]